jgi:hypothetical protein
VKNDVLKSILMFFFHQKSSHGTILPTPPFHLVLLLLQTTPAQDKPRHAVVCSPPFNIPVSFLSRAAKSAGEVAFSLRPALSVFLSVLMLPHYSGQISETAVLYYTPVKYWERWMYRRESNLAMSSSPVTNNNLQFLFGRTATMWNINKFLAVRRV